MTILRLLFWASILPCLIVLGLALELIRQDVQALRASERVLNEVHLVAALGSLVTELQAERGLSGGFVGAGGAAFGDGLPDQRDRTDAARDRVTETAARLGETGLTGTTRLQLRSLQNQMAGLAAHRARVDARGIGRDDALAPFSTSIMTVFAIVGEVSRSTQSGQLTTELRAVEYFMQGVDRLGRVRAIGFDVYSRGASVNGERQKLLQLVSENEVYFGLAANIGEISGLMAQANGSPDALRFSRAQQALLAPTLAQPAMSGSAWYALASQRVDALKQIEAQPIDRSITSARSAALAAREHATWVLRLVLGGFLVTLAISGIIVFVIRREVDQTVAATLAVADGDLDVPVPKTRTDEFSRLTAALGTLKNNALSARTQAAAMEDARSTAEAETRALSDLNEWLQASDGLGELFDMVERFIGRFIPEAEGSLYIYSNSRDVLDGACGWNGAVPQETMYPRDCWGLRKGRTYLFGDGSVQISCQHDLTSDADGGFTLCLPILAHGDTVGLMHLRVHSGQKNARDQAEIKRIAQACAEQISIAIANVRLRDQLHERSIRDALTGLFNRRHFTDRLAHYLEKARQGRETVGIVAIDVDHFKKFNDNYGHDAGDIVLRSISTVLEQACTGNEIACRLGGEELALLLPGLDEEQLLWRAEQVRQAIEAQAVRYGEKDLPTVTISAGVALAPEHGVNSDVLMKAADQALYRAKAQGRNRVEIAKAEGGTSEAAA